MGFKKGLLFVRVLSGQYMELFYTYRDVPDDYSVFHPQGVATVYAGRTDPTLVVPQTPHMMAT